MKSIISTYDSKGTESPPAWEAGIEICICGDQDDPHRRLPHGRRGLKSCRYESVDNTYSMSPPAWEAGIEMLRVVIDAQEHPSPPAWEAGIEILISSMVAQPGMSPPAWEAGIEMGSS